MARARRRGKGRGRLGTLLLALAALPLLYLAAALVGGLIPVNRAWSEPADGTTVYLRSNGIHVDLILPARAHGLDWRPLLPARMFRRAPEHALWFAFGAGERRVYLETPRWRDITPGTVSAALAGGERVLHVERTRDPGTELRAIRLRPEEYRRLWAALRAEFDGPPRRIDHPGYFGDDAFFEGRGRASAVNTCNQWVSDKLRIAGVQTGAWTPFPQGLMWRYRDVQRPQLSPANAP